MAFVFIPVRFALAAGRVLFSGLRIAVRASHGGGDSSSWSYTTGGSGPHVSTRVHGLGSLIKDFGGARSDLAKEIRSELKAAGEPVRRSATERAEAENFGRRTSSGYRVVASANTRGVGVVVRQSRRKTTGRHPEFARTQMLDALEPALDAHEGDVVRAVDKALERVLRKHRL